MLRHIYLDNYKCMVNLHLQFEERTLLLGANGAGKTSVLDAMFALRRLLVDGVKVDDNSAFPPNTLTRWQQRDTQTVVLDVRLAGEWLKYELEVEHDLAERQARIRRESLASPNGRPLYFCELGEVQLFRDDYTEGPRFSVDWGESNLGRVPPRPDNTRLTGFLDFMRKVTVCGLHPARFAPETIGEAGVLDRGGSNFADWYRHVLQERTTLTVDFITKLRTVIDGFQGIRLEQMGREARALMVDLEESNQAYSMRFDEISDGQRALIVLYGLVHLTQGHTLLLDEPDNFVALREIQPWLLELMDAPLPQAIICSHHPELIDYFGVDGSTLLHREAGLVRTCKPAADDDNGLKLSEIVARGWEVD